MNLYPLLLLILGYTPNSYALVHFHSPSDSSSPNKIGHFYYQYTSPVFVLYECYVHGTGPVVNILSWGGTAFNGADAS